MGKFDGLVGKFIISALIFMGMFSLIITIQDDNNAVEPAINDPTFNDSFSGLIEEIEQGSSDAEEKYGVFNSEEPSPAFGSIALFSIVSVGKSFSNIVFSFFGAIVKFPLTILGIAPNIYNLILTWLIIIAIVAAWLLYKLGG